MKIVNILVFIFYSTRILSQECGTVITQQQIEYMNQFEPEIRGFDGALTRGVRDFPIKAHIIRKSDGTGGLNESALNEQIKKLNAIYANANIRFVLFENINYINNSTTFDFDAKNEERFCSTYDAKNVINIFFFNSISMDGNSLCGYARFPESPNVIRDRVMMVNSCLTLGTLEHELGHYFSLYHTHGKSNFSTTDELADQSNCTYAGDNICDTPADPNMGMYSSHCTSDCRWEVLVKDAIGGSYKPLADNLMCYNPNKLCRKYFTPLQYARINYCAINQRNYLRYPIIQKTSNVPQSTGKPNTTSTVDLSGDLVLETSGQKMNIKRDVHLYRLQDIYYSGTNYRLLISNNQSAYIYVIGSDLTNKMSVLFPLEGQNSFIRNSSSRLPLPSSSQMYQLDNTVGKDYICILYSKKPIDITRITKQMEKESGSFTQRLYKVLGNDIVEESSIRYNDNNVTFSALSGKKSIVPLIVEIDHR